MATVGTGKYAYTVVQDWAKLPPGETFAMVSAMANHRALERWPHSISNRGTLLVGYVSRRFVGGD